jgi:hypothetical protein
VIFIWTDRPKFLFKLTSPCTFGLEVYKFTSHKAFFEHQAFTNPKRNRNYSQHKNTLPPPTSTETAMEAHASSQSSPVDSGREYHIACQVKALHELIRKSLFTHEVISGFHRELFRPSSSTSNQNETLERYIRSLSTAQEYRLNNELRIYDYTGHVSTFFVRDQELNASEADELFLIVDEWVSSVKTIDFAPHCSQETAAYVLQSKFDIFREEHRFRFWDQQKLKAVRYSLFGDCAACEDSRSPNPGKVSHFNLLTLQLTRKTVSSEATGMIHGQMTGKRQKMSLGYGKFHP